MFLSFSISCDTTKTKEPIIWTTVINGVGSFSSPRAPDLNHDGVKELVFACGKSRVSTNRLGGLALDERDGFILWSVSARDQLFGSPIFLHNTEDDTPNVIIGGRSGELIAIDGSMGIML